jgi:hypothetical protein
MAQEPISFEKVIKVDSVKSNAIYNGLKEWIGMNYRSAKSIIEVDDKEAGLLIISPRKDYSIGKLSYMCYDGTIKHTIKFQIKDGRFKVVVTNFFHENNPGNNNLCQVGLITTADEFGGPSAWGAKSYSNKVWKDIKVKAELLSNNLFKEVENLKFSTNKVDSKVDNW